MHHRLDPAINGLSGHEFVGNLRGGSVALSRHSHCTIRFVAVSFSLASTEPCRQFDETLGHLGGILCIPAR